MDSRSEMNSYDSGRNIFVIAQQTQLASDLVKSRSEEGLSSQEFKNLGMVYIDNGNYKQAQEFLLRAIAKINLETVNASEKQLFLAECHCYIANIEREEGYDERSIQRFLEAQDECKDTPASARSYDLKYDIERNLGISYLKIEQYKKAATNFKTAIDLAEKAAAINPEKKGRIPAVKSYRGLALVLSLESKEKTTEGFKELNEARELFPKSEREVLLDWASHRYHMGRAYESKNEPADAFVEYAEAHRLRLQIMDKSKIGPTQYHSRLGDVRFSLGQTCLKLGWAQKAKTFLEAAYKNYDEIKDVNKTERVKQFLAKVESEEKFTTSIAPIVTLSSRPNALGFLNQKDAATQTEQLVMRETETQTMLLSR